MQPKHYVQEVNLIWNLIKGNRLDNSPWIKKMEQLKDITNNVAQLLWMLKRSMLNDLNYLGLVNAISRFLILQSSTEVTDTCFGPCHQMEAENILSLISFLSFKLSMK